MYYHHINHNCNFLLLPSLHRYWNLSLTENYRENPSWSDGFPWQKTHDTSWQKTHHEAMVFREAIICDDICDEAMEIAMKWWYCKQRHFYRTQNRTSLPCGYCNRNPTILRVIVSLRWNIDLQWQPEKITIMHSGKNCYYKPSQATATWLFRLRHSFWWTVAFSPSQITMVLATIANGLRKPFMAHCTS